MGDMEMRDYISVQDAAKKWDLSDRQVQKMCSEGKIPEAIHFGRQWAIPRDAAKPTITRRTKPGPKPKNKNGQEAGRDGESEH